MKSMLRWFYRKIAGIIDMPPLPLRMDILNTQILQRQLHVQYRTLVEQGRPLPKLTEVGFRVFSQNDEDGILHYIFSLIGETNKVCVEIAFGTPYGGNTTNLILNGGWYGILISGTAEEAENVKRFFNTHPDSRQFPPVVYHEWITVDNVNTVVKKGLKDLRIDDKQIDLLSLDIDGVDFWIWKALESVEPRVIVVEYNPTLGNRSVTVPYKPDFNVADIHPQHYGASLPAFVKLAKEKGYRLIGCNKYGYNAFFIKDNIGEMFSEISAADCLRTPAALAAQEQLSPEVLKYEWMEV